MFLGMAFSFIKLISSSDTLTKRVAVFLKICPPAIITSAEVIIAEYDVILGQREREDFYNNLCNFTKTLYSPRSAVNIPFRGLATKHASLAISANKHGG